MHARTCRARGVDDRGDRVVLGLRRTGGQEVAVRPAAGRLAQRRGVLGVHEQQPVDLGQLGAQAPAGRPSRSRGTPRHPSRAGSTSRRRRRLTAARRAVRRCPAPRRPRTRRRRRPCLAAAARLVSRASGSRVGGMLFSGMSRIVVTPPAAAARVAVAKPSHSVRPGSLTWTWVSTRPGSRTTSPPSSTTSRPPTARSSGPTRSMPPGHDGDRHCLLPGVEHGAGGVQHQVGVGHLRTMSSGRTGTRVRKRPVASRIAASTAGPDDTVGGSPTPRRP